MAAAFKLVVVYRNDRVVGLVKSPGIDLRQGLGQLLAQGFRHHGRVLGGGGVERVVEHLRLEGPEIAVEKVLGEGWDLLAVLVSLEAVFGVKRQGFLTLKIAEPDGDDSRFFHGDSPLS